MKTNLFVPKASVGHAGEIRLSIQPFAEPRVHPSLPDGLVREQAVLSRGAKRIGDWFSTAILIAAAFALALLDAVSFGNSPIDESDDFENLASLPNRPETVVAVYPERRAGRAERGLSL